MYVMQQPQQQVYQQSYYQQPQQSYYQQPQQSYYQQPQQQAQYTPFGMYGQNPHYTLAETSYARMTGQLTPLNGDQVQNLSSMLQPMFVDMNPYFSNTGIPRLPSFIGASAMQNPDIPLIQPNQVAQQQQQYQNYPQQWAPQQQQPVYMQQPQQQPVYVQQPVYAQPQQQPVYAQQPQPNPMMGFLGQMNNMLASMVGMMANK